MRVERVEMSEGGEIRIKLKWTRPKTQRKEWEIGAKQEMERKEGSVC